MYKGKFKILLKIIKIAALDKLMYGFITFILITAFILKIAEPNINNYGDALWYCFVSFTTIGFGDIVVTSVIGRLCTVFLSLYGILIIGIIPGIIVNYYQEAIKIKTNRIIGDFFDDLENLPKLSKERLEEISENVKKRRYKI